MPLKISPPIHPGEILREEFLAPLGLKPYTLAKKLGVPRTRIERIVSEQTPITTDSALRLARYFGTTAQFWTNLQASYDLLVAEEEMAEELDMIEPQSTNNNQSESRLAP